MKQIFRNLRRVADKIAFQLWAALLRLVARLKVRNYKQCLKMSEKLHLLLYQSILVHLFDSTADLSIRERGNVAFRLYQKASKCKEKTLTRKSLRGLGLMPHEKGALLRAEICEVYRHLAECRELLDYIHASKILDFDYEGVPKKINSFGAFYKRMHKKNSRIIRQRDKLAVANDVYDAAKHFGASVIARGKTSLMFPCFLLGILSLLYLQYYLGQFDVNAASLLTWRDYMILPKYLIQEVFWLAAFTFLFAFWWYYMNVKEVARWWQLNQVDEKVNKEERQKRFHFKVFCALLLPALIALACLYLITDDDRYLDGVRTSLLVLVPICVAFTIGSVDYHRLFGVYGIYVNYVLIGCLVISQGAFMRVEQKVANIHSKASKCQAYVSMSEHRPVSQGYPILSTVEYVVFYDQSREVVVVVQWASLREIHDCQDEGK